jgi:hypothetical protein
MKLTKAQLNEMLNLHIGTGDIIIKTAASNIRIIPINLGANENWYAANGNPLESYLAMLADEIIQSGKSSAEEG